MRNFKVRCLFDNGPYRKGEVYDASYEKESPEKPFRIWYAKTHEDNSSSLMFSSDIFGNSRVDAVFLVDGQQCHMG